MCPEWTPTPWLGDLDSNHDYRSQELHEAVGLRDRGGPSLHDFVLVRRATRRGRRCWLIEERHRKVAKIEKPSVDILALLQVLQNPLRGLFRETALAGASNNDRNGSTTAEERAEEFGRIANILEGNSKPVPLFGWLLQKLAAAFKRCEAIPKFQQRRAPLARSGAISSATPFREFTLTPQESVRRRARVRRL